MIFNTGRQAAPFKINHPGGERGWRLEETENVHPCFEANSIFRISGRFSNQPYRSYYIEPICNLFTFVCFTPPSFQPTRNIIRAISSTARMFLCRWMLMKKFNRISIPRFFVCTPSTNLKSRTNCSLADWLPLNNASVRYWVERNLFKYSKLDFNIITDILRRQLLIKLLRNVGGRKQQKVQTHK